MATVQQLGKSLAYISNNERAAVSLLQLPGLEDIKNIFSALGKLFIDNSESGARQVDIAGYLRSSEHFTGELIAILQSLASGGRGRLLSLFHETHFPHRHPRIIDEAPVSIECTRIRTNLLFPVGDQTLDVFDPSQGILDIMDLPVVFISSRHTDQHFKCDLRMGILGEGGQTSHCDVSVAQRVLEVATASTKDSDIYPWGGLTSLINTITPALLKEPQ